MNEAADREKLLAFMEMVGRAAKGPGRIYLVGGSTALLLGIREQTIDIDLKLDPEPAGLFEAIADLKRRLAVNIELAAPDQFIPALPGWETRSEFIARKGQVDFYHYDYYGQALAKILRGHEMDLLDVDAYVRQGKIAPDRLGRFFEEIEPGLIRYPSVDIEVFREKVRSYLAKYGASNG